MKSHSTSAALLTVATTALSQAAQPAAPALDELLAKIQDKDDKVRGPAWQSAGPAGAPAVKPLAKLLAHSDFEVGRAAKRALWQIVRHAGRPGAQSEAKAVAVELVELLSDPLASTRREALWMLSEIGGDPAVPPIAALLADREVREDARAALERIPGKESIRALQKALENREEAFKPALAQSLRVRGVTVKGFPSQKLVPTRPAPGSGAKTI